MTNVQFAAMGAKRNVIVTGSMISAEAGDLMRENNLSAIVVPGSPTSSEIAQAVETYGRLDCAHQCTWTEGLFIQGLLNVFQSRLFTGLAPSKKIPEISNQVGRFLTTQLLVHPFERFILHDSGLKPMVHQAVK